MTVTPLDELEDLELTWVDDSVPGIERRRCGKSFTYRAPSGVTVRDPRTLERVRKLAIPPAWQDVWICVDTNGHVQATGRDARGRKQYRYHPRFRQHRDTVKYERLYDFGKALPDIRKR